MVTYHFYCIFETVLGREHSGKVSKKFIGKFYFWGITLRVIFWEYRESEDTHEKSIFLLLNQSIAMGELVQGKIVSSSNDLFCGQKFKKVWNLHPMAVFASWNVQNFTLLYNPMKTNLGTNIISFLDVRIV